ncbi:amidohydrolase family protein, partial [Salmonella enterica subsp. enterica serovar Typhi]|nr:amidohydrolase family protein [Salmonella enterica subsp. enterica serovar Typhi]
MIADLKIENGNIVQLGETLTTTNCLAIWNGLVIADGVEAEKMRSKDIYDLRGRTMLPAFIDAHTHMGVTGLIQMGISLKNVRDAQQALSIIENAAKKSDPEDWIEITDYDQRNLGRHLILSELDAVSHGRKIWVRHFTSHQSVVNSKVIECFSSEQDKRYALDHDGLLFEDYQDSVKKLRLPYSVAELEKAILKASSSCLDHGITAVIEAGIGTGLCGLSEVELAAYQNLRRQEKLNVRVQLMPYINEAVAHGALNGQVQTKTLDLGIRDGLGDEWLSLGGLKTWFDGGMMVRSAALSEPYVNSKNKGVFPRSVSQLHAEVQSAIDSGFAVAIHAIGDAAIDEAIYVLEKNIGRFSSYLPNRLEHGGLIRPDQIEKLKNTGVYVVTQPCFIWEQGDDFVSILGEDRKEWLYRGRSLLDNNIKLVASTDRPIAGTPLRAIHTMISRRTKSGAVIGKTESITFEEALRMWTTTAAEVMGFSGKLGCLQTGSFADAAVLSECLWADVPK